MNKYIVSYIIQEGGYGGSYVLECENEDEAKKFTKELIEKGDKAIQESIEAFVSYHASLLVGAKSKIIDCQLLEKDLEDTKVKESEEPKKKRGRPPKVK